MEVNAKLKELEDELKLLKAEIRNVLLDIREVILERTNPLGDEHEAAFIRMDLNTTARAMAAEVAMHEGVKAGEEAAEMAGAGGEEGGDAAADDEAADDALGAYAGSPETHPEEPGAPPGDEDAGRQVEQEPAPKVIRRDPREHLTFEPEDAMETPTNIPSMYQAADSLPPVSGSLSAWVTEAMDTIGPENLEKVIAMERLWGALPPNISRALAYLQELLKQSQEARPPWLKVMQDLDRLASP